MLNQIAELDASIQEQLLHFQTHHLETIPGIGVQTLAVLIAELGDNFTQRFTGPEALVALWPSSKSASQRASHTSECSD